MVLSEFREGSMAVTSLGRSSLLDYIYFAPMIKFKQNNGLHCRSLKLPKTCTQNWNFAGPTASRIGPHREGRVAMAATARSTDARRWVRLDMGTLGMVGWVGCSLCWVGADRQVPRLCSCERTWGCIQEYGWPVDIYLLTTSTCASLVGAGQLISCQRDSRNGVEQSGGGLDGQLHSEVS
jgi:hypothetical protein